MKFKNWKMVLEDSYDVDMEDAMSGMIPRSLREWHRIFIAL